MGTSKMFSRLCKYLSKCLKPRVAYLELSQVDKDYDFYDPEQDSFLQDGDEIDIGDGLGSDKSSDSYNSMSEESISLFESAKEKLVHTETLSRVTSKIEIGQEKKE